MNRARSAIRTRARLRPQAIPIINGSILGQTRKTQHIYSRAPMICVDRNLRSSMVLPDFGSKDYWCVPSAESRARSRPPLGISATQSTSPHITARPPRTGQSRESATDAHFDWFKSYADLASYLHDLVPLRSSRILVLGCGNSTLSEEVV
jgi:hypothetical protein